MSGFYEMDFMKDITMLVKVDELCNILKSLLGTAYGSRDDVGIGWSKFMLESALQYSCVYYAHHLLRARFLSLSRFLITYFYNFQIINVIRPVNYV